MEKIRRIVLAAALCLAPLPALAQSSPGLNTGDVPSAAQWNSYFSAKQDWLGSNPVLPSGVIGTSPIVVTPGAGIVGLSCPTCVTSGVWVLLNTLTASLSATLSDTTSFTSTYDRYLLLFQGIVSQTNSTSCRLRLNSAGVQTTGYLASSSAIGSGGATTTSNPTTFIPCSSASLAANSGQGIYGQLQLWNPAGTSAPKPVNGNLSANRSDGLWEQGSFGGTWNGGSGAVTGIQVDMASGSVSTGVLKIYGFK
jgi:hypothetical protein